MNKTVLVFLKKLGRIQNDAKLTPVNNPSRNSECSVHGKIRRNLSPFSFLGNCCCYIA